MYSSYNAKHSKVKCLLNGHGRQAFHVDHSNEEEDGAAQLLTTVP